MESLAIHMHIAALFHPRFPSSSSSPLLWVASYAPSSEMRYRVLMLFIFFGCKTDIKEILEIQNVLTFGCFPQSCMNPKRARAHQGKLQSDRNIIT